MNNNTRLNSVFRRWDRGEGFWPGMASLRFRRRSRFVGSHRAVSAARWIGSLLVFVAALVCSTTASALTQTRTPGSSTDCTSVAGSNVDWSNADNAFSNDGNYATTQLADNQESDYLQCTNYGFTIPAGSTINSITVNVERRTSSTGGGSITRDFAMRLVKGGSIGSYDAATTTNYTTSDFVEAHVGVNPLWGTTWNDTEINAVDFGAAFASQKPTTAGGSRTVSVDYIEIVVDYTAPSFPTVTSINRASPDPTTAGTSVSWTVVFSASVGGVDAGDFLLVQAGGVTGALITSVTGSGATRTITANTGTGAVGTLGLNLVDDDSITATVGGAKLGGAGVGNGNFTGQIYTLAPIVLSINRNDSNPTSASSVSWTVTFNTSVTGVDTADFALVPGGGVSGASITSVTGSGTTRTVTANTGLGNGTLGLNLVDDDSIVAGGIALGGTGAGNGNFTGQVYTVDKTAVVINTYYPGTANVAVGATTISVGTPTGAAAPIAAGDLVLIMQMQGASINTTNTDEYGDGVAGDPGNGATAQGNSGLYEYAVAAGLTGNTLTLTCGTINAYTNAPATGTDGQRTFQVIRAPVFANYTLGPITAQAWNGSAGGVLVFDVTGTLTLNSATVNVDGLGFRGGASIQSTSGSGAYTDYRTPVSNTANGGKGEGIAGTPRYVLTAPGTRTDTGAEGYPNGSRARGAPANAGGGGTDRNPSANDQNSGGGGGANAGAGGIGGIGWCPGFTTTAPYYGCGYAALASAANPGGGTGGFGGKAVSGLGATRLTMGGGGGGATVNNITGTGACAATAGLCTSGAAGGGIVMIRAGSMTGAATINANGSNADSTTQNDGTGGGGGGGAVMINAGSGMGGVTINVKGGIGGSNLIGSSGTDPHGPGGGGGGGYTITSAATAGCTASGGANGLSYRSGVGYVYGSTSGSGGSCATGLTSAQIPGATLGPVQACSIVDHYAISYPNGSPGVTCEALAVRITGHDASHVPVAPSNTTQITLTPGTGWALKSGSNPFIPPNKYTFNGTETFVEFWLTQTTPASININVSDGSKVEHSTEDPVATFVDTAFRYVSCPGAVPGSCSVIPINDQIAGKSSNILPNAQTLYLRSIRTDNATQACVGGLSGAQNVEFAYECKNPTTCSAANLMSINGGSATTIARNNNGTVSAIAGSYSAVAMTFDGNGFAPFNLNYSDAGQVTLHARKTVTAGVGTPPSTAATIYGASNAFVVRPFAFSITGPGIPAATGLPTDTVFAVAGQDFPARVTAVVWQAADDTNNDGIPDDPGAILSDNAATPNFGKETTSASATMTHQLFRPATGGVSGSLTGATAYTAFTAGASALQNLNWDEVGSIRLIATLTGGNYLASGQTVTGFVKPVGRFRPDHFIVTPVALTNRVQSNCSVPPKTTSTFTYVGEQMEVTNFHVIARNALATPGQTQNYASTFADPNDNFAKLNGTVFANFGFGAVDLADATPPLGATALTLDAALSSSSGSWTNGDGTFTARTAVSRTTPEGPYETFWLGILPADTDGVTLRAADLNLDTSVPADSNDHARVITASGSVRFGRLRLQNAYGSELLPLPVPMTVQYWNGTAFITNALDSCTTLTAANIGFANFVPGLAAGETTPTVGPVFSAGVGSLILSAPGTGNDGSADLVVNLGAAAADEMACPTLTPNPATTGSDRNYLRGFWCGTGFDRDPTARITFGKYKNPNEFIYLREMY